MSDFTDLCEVTLKAKKNEYLKNEQKSGQKWGQGES